MHKDAKEITLPNGSVTDTWSQEYMTYCEALNLSKKSLNKRREFLSKLKNEDRVKILKMWLKLFWSDK